MRLKRRVLITANGIGLRLLMVIILAVLMAMGLLLSGSLAAADSDQQPKFPLAIEPQKGHPKLESVLAQLVVCQRTRGHALTARFAEQREIAVTGGLVKVIVEALPGKVDSARDALEALGGESEAEYENLIRAMLPVSALSGLADNPAVRFVRTPWKPAEQVVSEGVSLVNAHDWRNAGHDGAGVKIGIIDSGFYGYSGLLGSELPAAVTTQWYGSGGTEGFSDHGTACAEIAYDIAPGADFYFASIDDEIGWCNAVDWLVAQGVDVISCSIGWPGFGSGDGTGLICEKVADAGNAGVLWSQAAGNYAERYWGGYWQDTDSNDFHEFVAGINQTNSLYADEGQRISVSLTWDDEWGSSGNDYDLLLLDREYILVAYSVDVQNGDDDPVERIVTYAPYSGTYYLAVVRYRADGGARFRLFATEQELTYRVAGGSLCAPADSPHALTVGAVKWFTPFLLESFSSQGPTSDGRIKPDVVAPDRVITGTYYPWEFPGTSASAPHAAGAAAVVMSAYPACTAPEVQWLLEVSAEDLGDVGKDNRFGAGRLLLRPPQESWVARYDGPPGYRDRAQALAVGAAGNVYVTGYSSSETDYDYVTVNYDGDGNQVWVARYNGPAGGNDEPRDIVVAESGDVYVAGYSAAEGGLYDLATVKYDADGNELWAARHPGPDRIELPATIAVDQAGNAYVTGTSQGNGTECDYLTVKYDAGGNELWAARYDRVGSDDDIPKDIAVDSLGNVYVTGSSDDVHGNPSAATVKYDASGHEVWLALYDGGHHASAGSLAVDRLGNVFVLGSELWYDWVIMKYDGSGNQVWVVRDDESSGASEVVVDEAGSVYVTGGGCTTRKYDSDGNEQWEASYAGSGGHSYRVALGGSELVCVAGWVLRDSTEYDYLTVAYDGAGTELWAASYNGPAASDEKTADIAADAAGNIYVTGYSGDYGSDYVTVKYVDVAKPAVSTGIAANVTACSAVLSGVLDDMGGMSSVGVSLEWGPDPSYGNQTPVRTLTSPGPFSAEISGLAPDTVYHFRARAAGVGVDCGAEMTFETAQVYAEIQIPLKAGWNMVSVPVIPDDNAVSAVFPVAAAVYAWEPARNAHIVPDVIQPHRGYLVAAAEDVTVSVEGVPVATWTGNVTAGWNLIGSVFTGSTVATLNDDPDGSVEPFACWWDPVGRSYVYATDIEPGKGYFVAATGECTLVMPATGPVSPTPPPEPPPDPGLEGVELLSHSAYWDIAGHMHIVGEVQNNGESNVKYVGITSYYGGRPDLLGVDSAYTTLDILVPGQKSPFHIRSHLQVLNECWYLLRGSYSTTTEEPFVGLHILSHWSWVDAQGYHWIGGQVQNNGDTTAGSVMVVATYYDSEGAVIGTDTVSPASRRLVPGQTEFFEVYSYPRKIEPASYSLQVQGWEE